MAATKDLPFEVTDDDRACARWVFHAMLADRMLSGDVVTSTLVRELGAQIIAAFRNKDKAAKFFEEMKDVPSYSEEELLIQLMKLTLRAFEIMQKKKCNRPT